MLYEKVEYEKEKKITQNMPCCEYENSKQNYVIFSWFRIICISHLWSSVLGFEKPSPGGQKCVDMSINFCHY